MADINKKKEMEQEAEISRTERKDGFFTRLLDFIRDIYIRIMLGEKGYQRAFESAQEREFAKRLKGVKPPERNTDREVPAKEQTKHSPEMDIFSEKEPDSRYVHIDRPVGSATVEDVKAAAKCVRDILASGDIGSNKQDIYYVGELKAMVACNALTPKEACLYIDLVCQRYPYEINNEADVKQSFYNIRGTAKNYEDKTFNEIVHRFSVGQLSKEEMSKEFHDKFRNIKTEQEIERIISGIKDLEKSRFQAKGYDISGSEPKHKNIYPANSFAGQTEKLDAQYKEKLSWYMAGVFSVTKDQVQLSNKFGPENSSYIQVSVNDFNRNSLKAFYFDAHGNCLDASMRKEPYKPQAYNMTLEQRINVLIKEFNGMYFKDQKETEKEFVSAFIKNGEIGSSTAMNGITIGIEQKGDTVTISLDGRPILDGIKESSLKGDIVGSRVCDKFFEKEAAESRDLFELVGTSSINKGNGVADILPRSGAIYYNLGSEAGVEDMINNSRLNPDLAENLLYPEGRPEQREEDRSADPFETPQEEIEITSYREENEEMEL